MTEQGGTVVYVERSAYLYVQAYKYSLMYSGRKKLGNIIFRELDEQIELDYGRLQRLKNVTDTTKNIRNGTRRDTRFMKYKNKPAGYARSTKKYNKLPLLVNPASNLRPDCLISPAIIRRYFLIV